MHAPDIIEELPKDRFMGFLEQASPDAPVDESQVVEFPAAPETGEHPAIPLEAILSAPDLTVAASKGLTPKTWAFYSSAATDLVTHGKNKELVRRVMLRPRILRDVTTVSMERRILGLKSSAPFFISPAAMARLVHPDGELALSRGAANEGIFQCVSCKL